MLKFLVFLVLQIIKPFVLFFGKFLFFLGTFYKQRIEHSRRSRKILLRQCKSLEMRLRYKNLKGRIKGKQILVFLFKVCIFMLGRLNLWLLRQLSIPVMILAAIMLPLLKSLTEIRLRAEISPAPGSRLLKIVDFFYQKEIVKGVFEQLVYDWRKEYFETISEKRTFKARWVSVRWRFIFYRTMFMQSPIGDFIEFVKQFVK